MRPRISWGARLLRAAGAARTGRHAPGQKKSRKGPCQARVTMLLYTPCQGARAIVMPSREVTPQL